MDRGARTCVLTSSPSPGLADALGTMMEPNPSQQDVLCFQCGQAVMDPPVLSQMPDGSNCQACANRVLMELPAIRPAEAEVLEQAAEREPDTAS